MRGSVAVYRFGGLVRWRPGDRSSFQKRGDRIPMFLGNNAWRPIKGRGGVLHPGPGPASPALFRRFWPGN